MGETSTRIRRIDRGHHCRRILVLSTGLFPSYFLAQEFRYRLDGLWFVEMHEMPGTLDNRNLRIRNQLAPGLRLLHRYELVFIAPHNQRGHLHAMQMPRELWI